MLVAVTDAHRVVGQMKHTLWNIRELRRAVQCPHQSIFSGKVLSGFEIRRPHVMKSMGNICFGRQDARDVRADHAAGAGDEDFHGLMRYQMVVSGAIWNPGRTSWTAWRTS